MSYRESADFLISRERTLQKKLREMIAAAAASDKNFLVYLEAMRERLRSILAPDLPAIPLVEGRVAVPRMD